MKLDTLITTQKDYLRGLADAWLPLGATTMTLAGSQGMIWAWPAPPPPTDTEPALQAPIMAGRQRLGTLSIYGDVRSPLQAQIEAQALMLGQLLRLEYETDSLTTELIDQQDQLLALYDLARTLSLHVDLHPTLEALMKESARLVHCGGAFILMCTDDATTEIVFHCTHPEIVSSAAACRLSEMLTDTQTRMLVSQPEDNHGHLPAHIDNLLSLAVPIHGQKRGLLGLFNHPTGFTSPEIKLAEAIVDHASMQIEKTLLQEASVTQTRLQTEMELARQVQLKLLP
ncbi:MAG: GAF domain-containing protein, partial [Anaerolineales bacterium]